MYIYIFRILLLTILYKNTVNSKLCIQVLHFFYRYYTSGTQTKSDTETMFLMLLYRRLKLTQNTSTLKTFSSYNSIQELLSQKIQVTLKSCRRHGEKFCLQVIKRRSRGLTVIDISSCIFR